MFYVALGLLGVAAFVVGYLLGLTRGDRAARADAERFVLTERLTEKHLQRCACGSVRIAVRQDWLTDWWMVTCEACRMSAPSAATYDEALRRYAALRESPHPREDPHA